MNKTTMARSVGSLTLATVAWAGTAVNVVSQTPLPRDTAVAIDFAEADGSTKPYLFYDIDAPFQMSVCEARLDYLTKQFYRMTRSNPDFAGKKAVRSACVKIEGFDLGN